jgi:hypothetical protein
VAAQRDLCYTEHSVSVSETRRVRKRDRKEVQEKLPNGADRITPSIALDFEENLMIGILTSALGSKLNVRHLINQAAAKGGCSIAD